HPGPLHGMTEIVRQSFHRGNSLSFSSRDRRNARANGVTFKMNNATAADGHSATVLSSREAKVFAQNPKQGLFRFNLNLCSLAIQHEANSFHRSSSVWARATVVDPFGDLCHKLIMAQWWNASAFARLPCPQDQRVRRHVMDQFLPLQSAVLLCVLKLAAELGCTASLKDHRHPRGWQVPARITQIECTVLQDIWRARRHVQSRLI